MKKSKHQEVDIPVTPMLDMAFQLLTFFILTYHPAPSEGQFGMNLLPASPAIKMDAAKAPDTKTPNDSVPASLRTITTQLFASPDGKLGKVMIEENELQGMDQLRAKLKEFLDPAQGDLFEQAVIQADPNLKYEELMKVIDVFSGLKINKISFAELEAGVSL
ncbi:MAG: biopolymer transport protein [Planctomycetota bacterium]|nr:biopolymer transport protein [Planctomycetota bacterium]